MARLFRVPLDGAATEVLWDRESYPYLATVEPDASGGAVVSVLSRDQRRQLILDLDPTGSVTVARERVTEPWITMQGGVPCRAPDGALLEIVANLADDCFQLVADDRPLTPAGLQVTGVLDVSDERILVTAQPGPLDQHVYSVALDGSPVAQSRGDGIHSASAGSGGTVIASTNPDVPGTRFRAELLHAAGPVATLAEVPVVLPRVAFHRVTERDLACAVLWPTDHVPGSRRLPVVDGPVRRAAPRRGRPCRRGLRLGPVAGRPGLRGRRRRRRRHARPWPGMGVRDRSGPRDAHPRRPGGRRCQPSDRSTRTWISTA